MSWQIGGFFSEEIWITRAKWWGLWITQRKLSVQQHRVKSTSCQAPFSDLELPNGFPAPHSFKLIINNPRCLRNLSQKGSWFPTRSINRIQRVQELGCKKNLNIFYTNLWLKWHFFSLQMWATTYRRIGIYMWFCY